MLVIKNYIEKNKEAWEYRAYEFWVRSCGTPEKFAEEILKNPKSKVRRHQEYLGDVEGLSIANICGSNGRKAVPLALLGAEVTIFDISKENKQYALELAEHCDVSIQYELQNFYDINIERFRDKFDILYLEGGILHYFHDLEKLMGILFEILKEGGRIVLNDFHPFRKVMKINYFDSSVKDYFNSEIHNGKVAYESFLDKENEEKFPTCPLRLYTVSEILNTMIQSGFIIKKFDESPSWTDSTLPGEITILAYK